MPPHEPEERRRQQPLTVNVQCSCCAETQREILATVRDIKRLLNEAQTVTEVRGILEPVTKRLESVSTS